MKKLLFLSFCVFFKFSVFSQDTYTMHIVSLSNVPMKNVEVTAKHSVKAITLKATTDNTGTAVFILTEIGKYTFSFLESTDVCSYEVRGGGKGMGEKKVTYDPQKKYAVKPKVGRTGLVFKTADAIQLKGQATAAKVTIQVRDLAETPIPNVVVEVVDIKGLTKYKGISNNSGNLVCFIPINTDFEVDISGVESLDKFNVPNYQNMEMEQIVYYEKTKMKEAVKGDTIIQTDIAQTTGTNTHLLFTITLKDFENNPLNNEKVTVYAQNKKRVYVGITNAKGVCKLMLEKGSNYIVNLKYEREIHLIEAPDNNSYASATATRRYRGSAVIEEMLAEQKRQMDQIIADEKRAVEEARLYAIEYAKRVKENEKEINRINSLPQPKQNITFRETPIHVAAMPSNYLKKTEKGFDIAFENAGPISTPTVIGDKLYTQQGRCSANFYCLNAVNGQYNWGIELGESGLSPVVHHEGVLLINTYSCTLYAIDALTGRLLWSKWLAGTIYSTPTASGNNVYAVYNYGGHYVISSFDLRSGHFNWMKQIDTESIACPVVEGNEVHVASQSGNYYVFNKDTGAPVHTSLVIHAVSSPTLTPESIYITAEMNGQEKLIVIDRKTMKIQKNYPTILQPIKINENHDFNAHMNFNGSHPIVYQNRIVILTDRTKIVAFDATTEKVLWQQPVQTLSNQIPIVANKKVVIATATGEVMTYDINTGAPIKMLGNKKSIEGQPIAHNGFLYIAAAGVLSVIKSVQNYEWNQWNKDASHNAIYR